MGIKEYLLHIGAVREDSIELFAERTRDAEVPVFRDAVSGVIFIDEFYVGAQEYRAAEYRDYERLPLEDSIDTKRRIEAHFSLIHDRKILDFGFGDGSFLSVAQQSASVALGIELDQRGKEFGRRNGIPVFDSISEVGMELDTIFAFHVLEHLPEPGKFLRDVREILAKEGGHLVIEVPHAGDFLLTSVGPDEFRSFTLWSQHLVLHTRTSLSMMFEAEGFELVSIEGVQRYGLGNHLGWLSKKLPGMHKKPPFVSFNQSQVNEAYKAVLGSLDSTDTLVAIASPRT